MKAPQSSHRTSGGSPPSFCYFDPNFSNPRPLSLWSPNPSTCNICLISWSSIKIPRWSLYFSGKFGNPISKYTFQSLFSFFSPKHPSFTENRDPRIELFPFQGNPEEGYVSNSSDNWVFLRNLGFWVGIFSTLGNLPIGVL